MLPTTTTSITTVEGSKPSTVYFYYLRELTGICFWLYAICNTFFFNADGLLAQALPPGYSWVLEYKFFAFFGAATTVLLTLKRTSALMFFGYVLSYPLIVLFWHIPRAFIRSGNWSLALGLLSSLIAFVYDLRYRSIATFVYLLCLTVAATSKHGPILVVASAILAVITVCAYWRAIKFTFSPNVLFQIYTAVFSRKHDLVTRVLSLDEELKALPINAMTPTQLKQWSDKLAYAVLFNRICLLAAKKLELFHNSGFQIVSGAISVMFLIVLTTLTFASINLAIYTAAPTAYETVSQPFLFTFVFYSFNALVNNFIREIVPAAPLSHLIWMVEAFCALVIIVLFAAHFVVFKSQKYSDQLAATAATLEKEGRAMEGHVAGEWRLASIDDAMRELASVKSDLLALLLWLTKYIK